jgi:homoserine dehydrogenase
MKKINIVLFGVGNVGSTLINQLLEARIHLKKKGLEINIPVILNSTTAFYAEEELGASWQSDFKKFGFPYKLDTVINYVKSKGFDNLIAIDATASEHLVANYLKLIKNGFNIIAANKIANTLSASFYGELRELLLEKNKHFLYETNVGAGLPVIQTLQNLFASGEKITKVRGVFSGSLSYIFNEFSDENKLFETILSEAEIKGYTEPDPRIDLSGKDVARKLLILARELDLRKELNDVDIEDLVPKHLNGNSSLAHFKKNKSDLNKEFFQRKSLLQPDEVLRHVGELDVDSGVLEVKLVREKRTSALGSLTHADASFEIFTKSYGDSPIVIKGAGAGADVTARGVLGDLIKLAEKLS